MSVKWKILIILLAVFAVFAALVVEVYALVVIPFIRDLERTNAKRDLDRCVAAIKNEQIHLGFFCQDWASWDDTWLYMQGKFPDFIESSFMPGSFTGAQINLMCLVGLDGKIVFGKAYDVSAEEPRLLMELAGKDWPYSDKLIADGEEFSGISGLIESEAGVLLVSSRPILTSFDEGPYQGTFIMGRLFDHQMTENLSSQVGVRFVIKGLANERLSPFEREIHQVLSEDSQFEAVPISAGKMAVFGLLEDVDGESILLLSAEVDRDIFKGGSQVLNLGFTAVILAGLIFGVLVLLLLQLTVLQPLFSLKKHIEQVRESGNLATRLTIPSRDEFGTLAAEFNDLLERLQDLRRKLVEQSYYAGMADLASGVMHSVRNSLTPVLQYIHKVGVELDSIPAENIRNAAFEIEKSEIEPDLRSDYEEYLRLSSLDFTDSLKSLKPLLRNLGDQAVAIDNLLIEFERIGRARRVPEAVKLIEVIRQALSVAPAALLDGIEIEITDETSEYPDAVVLRMSLQHVLANLITNAAEAIRKDGRNSGKIKITAINDGDEAIRFVRISVMDDGIGIANDELDQIFKRGYTTKRDASSGLGLHWCANTIDVLGGRIYAESGGEGKGAVFHVIFPADVRSRLIQD